MMMLPNVKSCSEKIELQHPVLSKLIFNIMTKLASQNISFVGILRIIWIKCIRNISLQNNLFLLLFFSKNMNLNSLWIRNKDKLFAFKGKLCGSKLLSLDSVIWVFYQT